MKFNHGYNEARIKISIGFRSPVEHRRCLESKFGQSEVLPLPS